MVEDSVETGIKSPEQEGMKRCRDSESHTTPPTKWAGHYKERWVFDTGATAHITNNDRYMYNLRPTKQTITVADSTVYPVQSKVEVVLRSICRAILTLKGVLYVPTAKNILSGRKIVQNPEHRVEIDSVGTRIICNAGTLPTLHMNYDNEGELWYFIGARVSPTAQVRAVTHGTVSEDKEEEEQETSSASRVSPTNKRNKIGSTSSNNNTKEETFSGYLQEYKSKSTYKATTNTKAQQKVDNKDKTKVKRIYLDINEAHQKFGHMSERMLQSNSQERQSCINR
jgi:hypothetical protein